MNTNLLVMLIGISFMIIIIKSMTHPKSHSNKKGYKSEKQKLYVIKNNAPHKCISNQSTKKKPNPASSTTKKQSAKVINLQERRQAKNIVMEKRVQSYSKIRK